MAPQNRGWEHACGVQTVVRAAAHGHTGPAPRRDGEAFVAYWRQRGACALLPAVSAEGRLVEAGLVVRTNGAAGGWRGPKLKRPRRALCTDEWGLQTCVTSTS